MSKIEILKCDIFDAPYHEGKINGFKAPVMFDHDQEDGKSKTKPYYEMLKIDMCESCRSFMVDNKKVIYGYGAMGYNKYFLN